MLAVFSDLHAGSMLAPCPPRVRLDDGGNYEPSAAQRWLWSNWLTFWARVAAVRATLPSSQLIVLSNGDAVEGNHHQTTQILSGNLEAQGYVLQEALSIPKQLGVNKWFVVRGTEAHVGPAGSHEESLARTLGAVPDPDTHTWSSWHHRLEIHGVRIDAQHHGRVGGRPWTQGAIAALAFEIFSQHAEKELPFPHIAIRSHRHYHADSFGIHKTRVIATAAWQLKTAHAHKVVAESIADVGGHIIVIHPNGTYTVEDVLFLPDQPTPTVIS